jgi:hypothetical protein
MLKNGMPTILGRKIMSKRSQQEPFGPYFTKKSFILTLPKPSMNPSLLLKDTALQSAGIRSGFYCPMSDLAIFYIGYGLPHRVLIKGLSPYTIYLQVAINIVNCQ